MAINPQHLRPGNWIYPTGRSKYVVVTGLLLGMMEKNEDLCKEFEGIELTGELLEAAGFKLNEEDRFKTIRKEWNLEINVTGANSNEITFYIGDNDKVESWGTYTVNNHWAANNFKYLNELQNLIFFLTGEELPLPESAKIIPQATK